MPDSLPYVQPTVSKHWRQLGGYFARLAWKRQFTPQKLWFWEYVTLKWGQYQLNPKRHILARVHVVWAIKRENPSTGLTCRWVRDIKRYKLKKNSLYFTQLPRSPPGRICTKFGTAEGVADVITGNSFFVIGQGVWILWGSKIALSHWQSQSPLNTPVALPRSPWLTYWSDTETNRPASVYSMWCDEDQPRDDKCPGF